MGTSRGRAVVVGVDASDSARQAVGWAAELASDTGRPLRLVHVAATPPPGDGMLPAWLRELVDTAERQGADPVEAELVEGGIADVLLERSGPDGFLVVGSYGEGVHAGMLAGTLALALLARADCAVAVVRGAAPGLPPPRHRAGRGRGGRRTDPPTPSWSGPRRSPRRTALTCSPCTPGVTSSPPRAATACDDPRRTARSSPPTRRWRSSRGWPAAASAVPVW